MPTLTLQRQLTTPHRQIGAIHIPTRERGNERNLDIIKIWRAFPDTQALIDYAYQIVPRYLTLEQRKQFFLESSVQGS